MFRSRRLFQQIRWRIDRPNGLSQASLMVNNECPQGNRNARSMRRSDSTCNFVKLGLGWVSQKRCLT
ncbi:hypothetical protein RISK_004246 [Rhodopirellula islandica]|uniref:Uncharacterized protein n=1 Tax=Rhodopirellula islandica TaxID=595434 RepID=A0A0J1EEB3_RHOIS|nr:hypothetical protein RISK_004246 [Rhodopirellula islandica]